MVQYIRYISDLNYIGLSPPDIGYVHYTHFNENCYRDYIGLSQGSMKINGHWE